MYSVLQQIKQSIFFSAKFAKIFKDFSFFNLSPALINKIESPCAFSIPSLKAFEIPIDFCKKDLNLVSFIIKFFIISEVLSVELPSIIMHSKLL